MNMPTMPDTPDHPTNNPALWARRQARAASLLPANFAYNVLRAARLEQTPAAPAARLSLLGRFFHNPFALSALTATACLAIAVIFHIQSNNLANEQNLADWRDILAQTESLDPL